MGDALGLKPLFSGICGCAANGSGNSSECDQQDSKQAVNSIATKPMPTQYASGCLQQFTFLSTTMPATTDLCDAHESKLANGTLRVLAGNFHHYGKHKAFSGVVKTLKVFEDNSLVRAAVENAGDGHVLVVDGSASLRCALLGGNLGKLAEKNGWAGVVLNAPIRDADEIDDCAIGVRALGTCPVKSKKTGAGNFDVPLAFGGVTVKPGDWCYADRDGVLFSDLELA